MSQPFDVKAGRTTGDALPVAEAIDSASNFAEYEFSLSQGGILAYTSGVTSGNSQLTWLDRTGKAVGVIGKVGDMKSPAISPDGSRIAVDRRDEQTGLYDIWLYDSRGENAVKFNSNSRSNQRPVWSPDGTRIAFTSSGGEASNAYVKSVSGVAEDEPLAGFESGMQPWDWSLDGRYIIGSIENPKSNWDVWVLPWDIQRSAGRQQKPFAYIHSDAPERWPRLSPNGRWLAYAAIEATRNEVYVRSFPMPGGKWQVSRAGGTRPVWSRDSKQLFFIAANGKMMSVDVTGDEDKFESGLPKPLFDARLAGTEFDVSKDGRFLIPVRAEQPGGSRITIVMNWNAPLEEIVP